MLIVLQEREEAREAQAALEAQQDMKRGSHMISLLGLLMII
jgi:hypothetical protein